MRMRVPALIITVCCLLGGADLYAQSWLEAYERGTAAAQKRDWPVVAEQMAKAIAEKPKEETLARGRRKSVLYVPHFWLGLALIETGDRAGGQRELRVSESQEVIRKTAHYSELRAALSGAAADVSRDREKLRQAAKGAADRELGLAMAAQVQATGAGATRTEQFRRASQKMQEGFAARKAADYDGALKSARAAVQLFGESLVAAKRSTARVPRQVTASAIPVPPAQRSVESAATAPAQTAQTAAPPVTPTVELAESKPVAGAAAVEPTVRERAGEVQGLGASTDKSSRASRPAASPAVRPSRLLEQAYGAFARGDLATADALAGMLIESTDKKLEGYMLRACARYTRSLLTNRLELERAAAGDFRSALAISPLAKLDPNYFSPKVIEFFQKQRDPG